VVAARSADRHAGCRFFLAAAARREYKVGDKVPLWASRVGPFNNPSETYEYYRLPFCRPPKIETRLLTLGEVLESHRLVNTLFDLSFRTDRDFEALCGKRELTAQEVRKFRDAIDADYYFQMFYDDLPLWGFIGKSEEEGGQLRHKLFTHFHFDIAFNGDKVIEINVSTDPARTVDISAGVELPEVEFSYSVKWKASNIAYGDRMQKYTRYSFLPQHLEIHWFSIINSCVTVLLLTGFLATVLMRILKNDFLKYSRELEDGAEEMEETGWKYVHGDVFRFPKGLSLFASIYGTGTQLFLVTLVVFALSLAGTFYPYNRGQQFTAIIVAYSLTGSVAGYCSAGLYKQMGGTAWVRNLLVTATIFSLPLLLCFSCLNTVAISYGSSAALPFGTIVILCIIWLLVAFPLTVLGGIAGKNRTGDFHAPCRTTKYPREIPPLPWYRTSVPQMLCAGFLPFSAVYIELYYIFATIWGHKLYTIYSVLFIVFILLIITTAFITIALTYFQLAVEDHRWWWRSVLCGGSTGLCIYAYCFYYFAARSDMSGLMQTSFFFGYMGVVCYGFFLMLGSIGFRASLIFVRYIYSRVKTD
jgi:hypothetical protein